MMVMFTASNFLRLAILVLGVWTGVRSCNTNKKVCDQLVKEANNIRLAEEKCTAMREYHECVKVDVEDCTDGTTDQYAKNLVDNFCNAAYLCREKLTRCYKDFNTIVADISQSDNKTRLEKCGKIVEPIMKCQESVMEECKGHSGILETVRGYQTTLNASCSNTIPCLDKILQCQSGIIDQAPAEIVAQNASVDCSKGSFDNCQAYRVALECMKVNLTSCQGQYNVDNIIVTLTNTTQEVCDPELQCTNKISSCLCHIRSKSSNGLLSTLMNICSTYDPFSKCLDNMDTQCRQIPDINSQLTGLRTSYGTYYTLLCTRDHGLCPPAVQCLADLPQPSLNAGASQQNSFEMDALCLAAGPVFECLGQAAKQCNEKKDKVTFTMLKNSFLNTCEGMAPHVEEISKCEHFQKCMGGFQQGTFATGGNMNGNTTHLIKNMYAGLAKVDFWCSYLNHGYNCIAENALNCSLGQEFAGQSRLRYAEINTMCHGSAVTNPPPVTTTKRTSEVKPKPKPKPKPTPKSSKPVNLVIEPSSNANPQLTAFSGWMLLAVFMTTLTMLGVH